MIFKQEFSTQNGCYTPILWIHLLNTYVVCKIYLSIVKKIALALQRFENDISWIDSLDWQDYSLSKQYGTEVKNIFFPFCHMTSQSQYRVLIKTIAL